MVKQSKQSVSRSPKKKISTRAEFELKQKKDLAEFKVLQAIQYQKHCDLLDSRDSAEESAEDSAEESAESEESAGELDWFCVECGESLGPGNPRQLCRKSYCGNVE